MKRIAPIQKPSRASPVDIVVALALGLVPLCYCLGFNLDWNLEVPPPQTAYTEAAIMPLPPAKPASQAPSQPAETTEPPAAAETATALQAGESLEAAEQKEWNEMVKRLQIEAISFPGRVSMYLKDLKRGRVWTYQPDDLFPSASLIKVPIMAAVFERIRRGELSLQTKVTLRRRHHAGGSGSLKWARDGTQFTVRQLLDHMIDESDNTATRMMIETVGMSYLQQQFPRMGLTYTDIYPEGMSLQSTRVTYENYTTAREMAALLERIYRGDLVDRFSSEIMLDIMKRQKTRARLAKALPPGWEIAHKTGLLRGACHDTAVIFTPQGDYVFVVLTGQNRSYHLAKDFITHLGRITYRYYKGDQSLFAKATGAPRHRARRRGASDFY